MKIHSTKQTWNNILYKYEKFSSQESSTQVKKMSFWVSQTKNEAI